jgi:hypothetical protein
MEAWHPLSLTTVDNEQDFSPKWKGKPLRAATGYTPCYARRVGAGAINVPAGGKSPRSTQQKMETGRTPGGSFLSACGVPLSLTPLQSRTYDDYDRIPAIPDRIYAFVKYCLACGGSGRTEPPIFQRRKKGVGAVWRGRENP